MFKAAPQLDGKQVVFGRVVAGLAVVRLLERVSTSGFPQNKPRATVLIANCGQRTPLVA